jgi:hypothetical protein
VFFGPIALFAALGCLAKNHPHMTFSLIRLNKIKKAREILHNILAVPQDTGLESPRSPDDEVETSSGRGEAKRQHHPNEAINQGHSGESVGFLNHPIESAIYWRLSFQG